MLYKIISFAKKLFSFFAFILENDGLFVFSTPFYSIVLLFGTHVFSCSIMLSVFLFFCSLEAITENNF